MRLRNLFLALLVLVSATSAFAEEKPKKLTDDDRKTILRNFIAETPFAHRYFPAGKTGIKIVDGVISPSEEVVRQLVADFGPAVKPGDRAKITDIRFVKNGIVFEVNGGPVKKKKWYERMSVGVNGAETTTTGRAPDRELYTNARGSFVMLGFKDGVPSLTPDEIKKMLAPVFDWGSMSIAEAYQKSLPPKLAEAVKDHKALVGMDREMVTYAKGRAPKKHRERTDDGAEYEEWIYGQPPNDVEFVRFVGDKVVQITTMKVDGEKIVRNQDEVGDLNGAVSAMAKKPNAPAEQESTTRRNGPSLMRPGEQTVTAEPSSPNKTTIQRPDQDGTDTVGQPDPNAGPAPR